MMHNPPRHGQPWHPANCRGCDVCRPPAPSDKRWHPTPADMVAIVALAGFAVGLLLAWAFDGAVGGPGLGVMFQ